MKALELAYRQRGTTEKVVGPVDLEIQTGEFLGIIGESGAGKSTLGYEMLDLLRFKNGVLLAGETIRRIPVAEMSYIPQDPLAALDPLFSIGSQMRELTSNRAAIEEALKRVHLPLEKISLKSYPHELSGGMRQRLVIAMALLRRPQLIVADEPTSSLDVTLQADVMNLFWEIHGQGVTFVFITHDLALAAGRATRLAVMQHGRILELGSPAEVLRNPKTDYTRMLINSVPVMKR